MPTARYNSYYSRPYEVNATVENLENLSHVLEQSYNGVGNSLHVDPFLVAGSSNTLVRPSVAPMGNIELPNGWNTERLLFNLEVEIHDSLSTRIYHVQGYSEYHDPSYTGSIDPNMKFYINSIIQVSRTYDPISGINRDNIIKNNNILFDNSEQIHYNNAFDAYGDKKFLIRPQDIYTGIETAMVTNTSAAEYNVSPNMTIDSRAMLSTGIPQGSNKINNRSNQYLSTVINSWYEAKQDIEIGNSQYDVTGKAAAISHEDVLLNDNLFMRLLSMEHGASNSYCFTMGDLMVYDENAPMNTNLILRNTGNVKPINANEVTEQWSDVSYTTQAAVIIGNSLPSLMAENYIANIAMSSTNDNIGGQIMTYITKGQSFINADMTQYFNRFSNRFELEVMRDITYNGNISASVFIEADIYGDIWIELSINNEPPVRYALPAYCDSVTTPIIVRGVDNYTTKVNDFESVFNIVDDVGGSYMGQNISPFQMQHNY